MDARLDRIAATANQVQADVATLETDVRDWSDQARGELRLLFGATIVTAIVLATLLAKGFAWL